MRFRVVGATAACALVFLAYAPFASADTITLQPNAAGAAQMTAIPDRSEWDTADFQVRFNATVTNGQLTGEWDFETVNPFLRDMAHSGDDVQAGWGQMALADARQLLSEMHGSNGSATLVYNVSQVGDRDGDTLSDYHSTLASSSFRPSGFGSNGQPMPTPEPASVVLLGSGLAGLVAYRLRGRQSDKSE